MMVLVFVRVQEERVFWFLSEMLIRDGQKALWRLGVMMVQKKEGQSSWDGSESICFSFSITSSKKFPIQMDDSNPFLLLYKRNMDILVENLEKVFPRKKIPVSNENRVLNSPFPYYLLALLTFIGLMDDRPNPFVLIAIIYGAFPLIDEVLSADQRNASQEERKQLQEDDEYYRMPVYAAMVLDWVVFIKMLTVMKAFEVDLASLPELLGIIFMVSNLSSSQFAIAHQIMHRPAKFYRLLATLHISKLCYMHFTYHHLYKHHSQVATPNDPSTSKKGESVYRFILRSIKGSWQGVYQSEVKLQKPLYENCAVLSIVSSLVIGILIYLVFGLQPLIIHICVALGAIIYLEAINYIQHYGLQRKKLPNGEYEKVTILHSWNAPHRFSNYLLFKLQRHSDHHQNSMKPYQTLASLDQSPLLPHGYSLMVIMPFYPQVWFRVMDPLVEAYERLQFSDKGKINGQVREKATIEARKFMLTIIITVLGMLGLSVIKII